MASFSAEVADWVRKSEKLTEAVFKESTQRVVGEMQKPQSKGGRMPIDTGHLRASLAPSVNATNVTLRPATGQKVDYDDSQVALNIAGLELGDTFYAVYAANYAAAVNYGAQGRAPAGFVEGAAAQWVSIVKRVTHETKARMGAN